MWVSTNIYIFRKACQQLVKHVSSCLEYYIVYIYIHIYIYIYIYIYIVYIYIYIYIKACQQLVKHVISCLECFFFKNARQALSVHECCVVYVGVR
jgi:hypothetical protein